MGARDRCVLVFDESHLWPAGSRVLRRMQLVPLNRFSPDGTPALFSVQPSRLHAASRMWQRLHPAVRSRSVVTGRHLPGEPFSAERLSGTVMVPWCEDDVYLRWLAFLTGDGTCSPSPDWFFARDLLAVERPEVMRLSRVFHELTPSAWRALNASALALRYPCSRSTLERHVRQLYRVTPGRLCRVCRLFAQTAHFMQLESRLHPRDRYGQSPLRSLEGDFLDSLRSLIGLTYTELRRAAEHEHWVATWMRALRRSGLCPVSPGT